MSELPIGNSPNVARSMSTDSYYSSHEHSGARFSVDVVGLLEALTEQFPEPLLCVRELIQNAADAEAQRIDVDISYDKHRNMTRLSVRDDGRGMSSDEVQTYLTIGLSNKDPSRDRGRFGIGKLSPYALGFEQMVVETNSGETAHRLEFRPDGSGHVREQPEVSDTGLASKSALTSPYTDRGTSVHIYKSQTREEAEAFLRRTHTIVNESCGSLQIPLFVNGVAVNQILGLTTPYVVCFESGAGSGVIGVGSEPVYTLLSGGIVLEMGAPLLGDQVSYLLDAPQLSPTLSRNAVRRDSAFDNLLRSAQAELPHLVEVAGQVLSERVARLRQSGAIVERALEPNDRAVLEWLRVRLLDPEAASNPIMESTPLLETADGDLVSANMLTDIVKRERHIPFSRVPRTPEEISGYVDRGIPVLLLYRDLEDFLLRQKIPTIEVDGWDDGIEVADSDWSQAEIELAKRFRLSSSRFEGSKLAVVATIVLLMGGCIWWSFSRLWFSVPTREPVEVWPSQASMPPSMAEVLSEVRVAEAIPSYYFSGGILCLGIFFAVSYLLFLRIYGRQISTRELIPRVQGDRRHNRILLMARILIHPIDFVVARGWSRPSRRDSGKVIAGKRAFAKERSIKIGMRLDLDQLILGYIDLMSKQGDPSDARMILQRDGRVLLNRHHPTIRNLIKIAEFDPYRARVLLDALLATDPELAGDCDPRQIEWDLVARAPKLLTAQNI